MNIENSYDVLIVGSGPAGAAAAKALDGSGLSVAIIERKKLPRYKMCSGIIFPSSRAFVDEYFGPMPEEMLCEPGLIKGNRVFLNNETPVMDTPFSLFDEGGELPEEGFNVWRSDFDLWLAKESRATLIDDCRFTGFIEKDGQYEVSAEKSGEQISFKTRHLIGADGTISQVRRSTFPDFDKKVNLIPNYEEIYEGSIDLEPGWLYIFLDRSLSNYFATLFHKDNKLAVVTGAHQGQPVKEFFNAFRNHLEKNHGLKITNQIESHGIQLNDMSAMKNICLGRENILLTGEAGGFLRGGEGITSALVSGYAAGKAVLASQNNKTPAIDHFKEFSAEELAICEKVHSNLTELLGFNVFKRNG